MTERLLLTRVQANSWRSAKRESMADEDRIAVMEGELCELGTKIKACAERAAKRYSESLEAIFEEHGVVGPIPEDTRLEQEGTSVFFVFDVAQEVPSGAEAEAQEEEENAEEEA